MLIGNTHWHWAEKDSSQWNFSHCDPDIQRLKKCSPDTFMTWAAVGPVPSGNFLDLSSRLQKENIPLGKMPRWLGIDRALGAWGALMRARESGLHASGLLVVDAGTVCSLTRVTANGDFDGGQLIPGLRLQLTAMARGTKDLFDPGLFSYLPEPFPQETSEAMRRGSLQALFGALIEAKKLCDLPLWLCGGDAPLLLELLNERKVDVFHQPDLVLEGMINIQSQIIQVQGRQ